MAINLKMTASAIIPCVKKLYVYFKDIIACLKDAIFFSVPLRKLVFQIISYLFGKNLLFPVGKPRGVEKTGKRAKINWIYK